MTQQQLYAYYGEAEVADARNFKIQLVMNGKDKASFTLPNKHQKQYNTWKARHNTYIEIWERSTDKLFFAGWIKSMNMKDPMTVYCIGYLDAMDWYPITEENSKMIVDQGAVSGVDGVNLKCQTVEAEDPGWANDQYNSNDYRNYYAIVSDQTKEDAVISIVGCKDSSTILLGNNVSGTYLKTATEDQDYWQVEMHDHFLHHSLRFEFEEEELNISNTITKLRVIYSGRINALLSAPMTFYFWWRPYAGATPVTYLFQQTIYGSPANEKPVYFDVTKIINDSTRAFKQGASFWEAGVLEIWCENYVNLASHGVDYVKIEVTYVSNTFDIINEKITDTVNNAGYDTLVCGTYNFADHNVTVNDGWAIGIGLTEAFQRCFSSTVVGLNAIINGGTIITKGIANDFYGVSGLDLFIALCQYARFVYFVNTVDDLPVIQCISEDDIADATITFDKSNNPCSLNFLLELPDTEYGGVIIFYSNGNTGIVTAATPSTNPKIKIIRDKNILTLAEAMAQAMTLAEQLSTIHRSITPVWDYLPTNMPEIGKKYDFNIDCDEDDDEIPETTESFTDQICRRLEIEQDGAMGKFMITGYFGGASSPSAEKFGKAVGDLAYKERIRQTTEMNSFNSPITRHPQLLGIAGSSEGVHVSAAERALITDHTSVISNVAFAAEWNGDTTRAPSKDVVYDQINGDLIYVDLTTGDDAAFDYAGSTATSGADVVLDVVNNTSTETNVTQITDIATSLPSTVQVLHVRLTAITDSASASNYVLVRPNGNTGVQDSVVVYPQAAGYYNNVSGNVCVKSNKVQIFVGRGAGTITFYFIILGYWRSRI